VSYAIREGQTEKKGKPTRGNLKNAVKERRQATKRGDIGTKRVKRRRSGWEKRQNSQIRCSISWSVPSEEFERKKKLGMEKRR